MKTLLLSLLFSTFVLSLYAQNNVGINNPAPDPSAVLDLTSDNMGLLLPRVADTNSIAGPAEGLMIYDLSSHCMRYFNGTKWSDCMGNIIPPPWACGDNFLDSRDGQVYPTVQIGNQCWMAKNLNIGTVVNWGTEDQTNNGVFEKFCYDNIPANCDEYGGMYHWGEVMQYITINGGQGICPEGWHVPTDDEFCTLENEVDIGPILCNTTGFRGINAGGNLKETGTAHWNSPNNGATNLSGFSARGAGEVTSLGFYDLNIVTVFHTSSDAGGNYVYGRSIYNTLATILRHDSVSKASAALSVRCIKD